MDNNKIASELLDMAERIADRKIRKAVYRPPFKGKLTEARKIKVNYSRDVSKIGDEVSLRINHGGGHVSGTDGIVFDVKNNGEAFRLKDKYGNKNNKWFYIKDFKKAKVKRVEDDG